MRAAVSACKAIGFQIAAQGGNGGLDGDGKVLVITQGRGQLLELIEQFRGIAENIAQTLVSV